MGTWAHTVQKPLSYSPAANKNLRVCKAQTRCNVAGLHVVPVQSPAAKGRYGLATARRNAQHMFWSMARKNKDALVLGRDKSPNQIRMQTWVEKGQLNPDVLNFPETLHYVPSF